MENKNYIWRPVSEYVGGRVLATNGLDVLIGEINSDGDCESEEGGSTILCGITGFIKIEEMLPEPKESEDEKIRKAIIMFFELQDDNTTYSFIPKKDILAWLEKQGEQNLVKFKPSFRVGDMIKPKDPVLGGPRIIERVHPTWGYDTNKGILDFEFEDNWELVEQNHADKVEPKFNVGDVMRTLQEAADNITDGMPVVVSIDNEYYRCNNEIIAIKDQDNYEYPPINKKHNAWRVADENTIDEAVEYLENYAEYVQGGNSKQYILDLASRVDKLRPKPYWKPSEVQMNALHDAAVFVDMSMFPYPKGILMKLYEQLKKLREE